jgi:hypothetical protein
VAILGVFICELVAALYSPIFKLGSVVQWRSCRFARQESHQTDRLAGSATYPT